jgi:hypothetical protein
VFGRDLVAELPNFVHRPYVVVTMADLWPGSSITSTATSPAVHEVTTIEVAALDEQIGALPDFGAVVGLGGGRASTSRSSSPGGAAGRSSRSRRR